MRRNDALEFPIGPEPAQLLPGDTRRFDPISAIAGGVGLVGNIAGGIIGSGAAKKAGEIQQQAATTAANNINAAVGQANQPIAEATANAQGLATTSGNRVLDTAGAAKSVMDEATKNANAGLDPYATAGATAATGLNTGLAAGGEFNKPFTAADLQMDPGYAWRQQQAELALARRGAATGGYFSGAALKDLNDQIQGMASNEFTNAFNRYETDTQSRYNRLFGTAGMGMDASKTAGGNLMTAAQYGGNITTDAAKTKLGADEFTGQIGLEGAGQIGGNIMSGARTAADLMTGGAAARAAGTVGAANAWSGALSGGANSVMSAAMLNKLKNPAVTGRVP